MIGVVVAHAAEWLLPTEVCGLILFASKIVMQNMYFLSTRIAGNTQRDSIAIL